MENAALGSFRVDARLVEQAMERGAVALAAGTSEMEVADVIRKLACGSRRPDLAQQEGDIER
jgi:hypothetical protein